MSAADVVWALMKGSPYWPARIESNPPPNIGKMRPGNVCVFFFGTKNYGKVSLKSITGYKRNYDLHVKKGKGSKFKYAVEQADQFLSDPIKYYSNSVAGATFTIKQEVEDVNTYTAHQHSTINSEPETSGAEVARSDDDEKTGQQKQIESSGPQIAEAHAARLDDDEIGQQMQTESSGLKIQRADTAQPDDNQIEERILQQIQKVGTDVEQLVNKINRQKAMLDTLRKEHSIEKARLNEKLIEAQQLVAEKNEMVSQLAEKVDAIELSQSETKIDAMTKQLKVKSVECAKMREQIKEQATNLEELQDKVKSTNHEITELAAAAARTTDLEAKNYRLVTLIGNLKLEINGHKTELDTLKKEQESWSKEKTRLTEKLTEAQELVTEKNEMVTQLAQKVDAIELSQSETKKRQEAKIDGMTKQLKIKSDECANIREQIREQATDFEELRGKVKSANHEITELAAAAARTIDLEAENCRLVNLIDNLKLEINGQKTELDTLRKKQESCSMEKTRLTEKLTKAQELVTEKNDMVTQLAEKVDAIELSQSETKKKQEAKIDGMTKQLKIKSDKCNKMGEQIHKLSIDIEKLQQKLSAANNENAKLSANAARISELKADKHKMTGEIMKLNTSEATVKLKFNKMVLEKAELVREIEKLRREKNDNKFLLNVNKLETGLSNEKVVQRMTRKSTVATNTKDNQASMSRLIHLEQPKQDEQCATASNKNKKSTRQISSPRQLKQAKRSRSISESTKRKSTPSKTKKRKSNFYDVDKLLDHKQEDGKIYFLVHWSGYESEADSWIPESNLKCAEMLRQYKLQHIIP